MAVMLDLQVAVSDPSIPAKSDIKAWVETALADRFPSIELTIRIVDEAEMTVLNRDYRHKTGSTNVLSFPFEAPEAVVQACLYLGDIVICAPVVVAEALRQQTVIEAHWAHMVFHGVLHLLGFDHQTAQEADAMEALEIQLLAKFGYANPYENFGETHV